MTTIFLTGATGLIGSNVAEQLVERGDQVRALVRPGSDARGLEALGVSVVRGDVRDADSVRRAAEDCRFAIHSAAVLGGPVQAPEEHEAVNVRGTAHVLDAAAEFGFECAVALSTTTFFEVAGEPLREGSPLDPSPSTDPYTQTKRRAFLDAMRRVQEGQDVRIVVSGGAFGRAPLPERSMAVPSFNQRAVAAIEGELRESVAFPIPWVYAADVARAAVRALDRGGRRRVLPGLRAHRGRRVDPVLLQPGLRDRRLPSPCRRDHGRPARRPRDGRAPRAQPDRPGTPALPRALLRQRAHARAARLPPALARRGPAPHDSLASGARAAERLDPRGARVAPRSAATASRRLCDDAATHA